VVVGLDVSPAGFGLVRINGVAFETVLFTNLSSDDFD